MARRRIGHATVYVTALDEVSDDGRWRYECVVTVPKSVAGTRVRYRLEVRSGVGGVRAGDRLVALDSPEAYDQVARSAVALAGCCTPEEPDDPDRETADAIFDAVGCATLPDGSLRVERR